MKIAVCVDDNRGMLFNKRRQSRDKVVLADLMTLSERIRIHPFSEKLFTEYTGCIDVNENFLEDAQEDDLCFVENQLLKPQEELISQLIVYKWNRKYPADFRLDLDLSQWNLKEQIEFVGNSHEKITREIYDRGEN